MNSLMFLQVLFKCKTFRAEFATKPFHLTMNKLVTVEAEFGGEALATLLTCI